MSLTFDWQGFAKMWMRKMDCVPVPLQKDGEQLWDGWEKLWGKSISDKDLDRWVKSDDFGGWAGLFEWCKVPIILSPTVNDLLKDDSLVKALEHVDVENTEIDYAYFLKSMMRKYVRYSKRVK